VQIPNSLLHLTRNFANYLTLNEVVMLSIKIKKILLSIFAMSMFLSPVLTHAEPTGTGSTASRQASDQKAALAKKAAAQQKAAEEKLKAEQAAQAVGVEVKPANAAEK
jgi:hypothetical protein